MPESGSKSRPSAPNVCFVDDAVCLPPRILLDSDTLRTSESFLKNRQKGWRGAEAAVDFPQGHLPLRAPWPAAGHVLDAAVTVTQPHNAGQWRWKQHLLKRLRSANQKAPPTEKPEGEETPAGTGSSCRRWWAAWWASRTARPSPMWKSGRGWSAFTGRVFHRLTAHKVLLPARHWGHPLLPLLPPQVACSANKGTDFSLKWKKKVF